MATNGLNKITEKILSEAQTQADRILAEAEADCEKIRAEYAAKADQIREDLSDAAEQKGKDMIARARSAASMKKRNLLLTQRSELIDSVFADAEDWVKKLNPEKYTELLVGLLTAAFLEQAETEEKNRALYADEAEEEPDAYEIILNKHDRELCGTQVAEGAKKKLTGKISAARLAKLRLSEKTVAISGGVILRYGDVESNCSLEMLFAQLRRELEAEVSHALFAVRGQNN